MHIMKMITEQFLLNARSFMYNINIIESVSTKITLRQIYILFWVENFFQLLSIVNCNLRTHSCKKQKCQHCQHSLSFLEIYSETIRSNTEAKNKATK